MTHASRRGAMPRRVAGLISTPAGPIPDDMQAALSEREKLIEATARRSLHNAIDTEQDWTTRLGRPGANRRARGTWLTHATTIALYRHRYGITGAAPLGNPKDITKAQQAAEYRTAHTALRRAQSAGEQFDDPAPHRDAPRVEQRRRL